MDTFGLALRALREKREVFLKNLAQQLGWSVPYVSDVERGKRNPPSKEDIFKICSFLDVCPKKLLSLADQDRGVVEIDLINLDDKKRQMVLTFAREIEDMGLREVEQIWAVVNSVAESSKKKEQGKDGGKIMSQKSVRGNASSWSNGSANHATGSGLGLRIDSPFRNSIFNVFRTVDLYYQGNRIAQGLNATGKNCQELIKTDLGLWLISEKKDTWPRSKPHRFNLTQIGKTNGFEIH